jgi:hypothetical protein
MINRIHRYVAKTVTISEVESIYLRGALNRWSNFTASPFDS